MWSPSPAPSLPSINIDELALVEVCEVPSRLSHSPWWFWPPTGPTRPVSSSSSSQTMWGATAPPSGPVWPLQNQNPVHLSLLQRPSDITLQKEKMICTARERRGTLSAPAVSRVLYGEGRLRAAALSDGVARLQGRGPPTRYVLVASGWKRFNVRGLLLAWWDVLQQVRLS